MPASFAGRLRGCDMSQSGGFVGFEGRGIFPSLLDLAVLIFGQHLKLKPKGHPMDLTFNCPNCHQQLEADSQMSGTSIACPACNKTIVVPEANPATVHTLNAMQSSAASKVERHFSGPVHDEPAASLIQTPNRPLEGAATESDRKLRIKCIKRTECVEVGKDHFDEVVSEFLGKVGETNIVSINTLNYTHVDVGTRQILTDYGVLIVYKG